VVLFNSDGPMLLFFRPDQQSASVLNKGDLCEDRIPREGAREVASGKLGIQMAV
jgi:hypothetical protein